MSSLMLAAAIAGENQATNNKLLAHKSSFQAWKCVSFGCSLLAAMLLMSKCYEVSSDLHLLLSIERLLIMQEQSAGNGSSSSTDGSNNSSVQVSWPPVPIDMVLPNANETSSSLGIESLESNGSMLMSHMHMSLRRELNGNQLLRQEVGAFIAEFKMAKSTLSLSSLLVAVYIVSWILMTLAINDTRISNDISLRNILLLSVFGAIDVAASVGFVMVRLIMFSVKNSSFASQLLGSSGLKDTPVRLSPDQMTAFTALRLIGMRSCSAYMDLYVSTVVVLLTILRLYAILRALSYYRHLRRLTDEQQLLLSHHQQQQQVGAEQKHIWASGLLPPGAHATFAAHHMIAASNTPPLSHSAHLMDHAHPESMFHQLGPATYQQQSHQQHMMQHRALQPEVAKSTLRRYHPADGSQAPPTIDSATATGPRTKLQPANKAASYLGATLSRRQASEQQQQVAEDEMVERELDREESAQLGDHNSSEQELIPSGNKSSSVLHRGEQFTLLDADQLDRLLGRRLPKSSSTDRMTATTKLKVLDRNNKRPPASSIYHTTGRRGVRSSSSQQLLQQELQQVAQKNRRVVSSLDHELAAQSSDSSSGSSNGGREEEYDADFRPEDEDSEPQVGERSLRRKRRFAHHSGARQTEELVLSDANEYLSQQHRSRLVSLGGLNGSGILLSKSLSLDMEQILSSQEKGGRERQTGDRIPLPKSSPSRSL